MYATEKINFGNKSANSSKIGITGDQAVVNWKQRFCWFSSFSSTNKVSNQLFHLLPQFSQRQSYQSGCPVDSYENDHHFSLKCAHCSYSKVDSVILPYSMEGFSWCFRHLLLLRTNGHTNIFLFKVNLKDSVKFK